MNLWKYDEMVYFQIFVRSFERRRFNNKKFYYYNSYNKNKSLNVSLNSRKIFQNFWLIEIF